jgi:hypothetical protein
VPRFVIHFETKPHAGQDEAFNVWYDTIHVPDVLRISGYKSCERFRVLGNDGGLCYIASYEVECEDPQEIIDELVRASKSMVISPALDRSSTRVRVLQPLATPHEQA